MKTLQNKTKQNNKSLYSNESTLYEKLRNFWNAKKYFVRTKHYSMQHNLTSETQTLAVKPLVTTHCHDLRRKIITPTTKNRQTRSQTPAWYFGRIFLKFLDHAKEKEAEHSTYKISFNF